MIARLAVERREDPVAPRPHLANADGIPRLVAIPEPRPAVARQVQYQGQQHDPERLEPPPAPRLRHGDRRRSATSIGGISSWTTVPSSLPAVRRRRGVDLPGSPVPVRRGNPWDRVI